MIERKDLVVGNYYLNIDAAGTLCISKYTEIGCSITLMDIWTSETNTPNTHLTYNQIQDHTAIIEDLGNTFPGEVFSKIKQKYPEYFI